MSENLKTVYGLGRREALDERDHAYRITQTLQLQAIAPAVPESGYKYWWPNGWWGDQQNTPHCVAFSWTHWLEDGPITHAPFQAGAPTIFNTNQIYNEAQKVDEWPGENYAGTSVRAGAKILQKQLGVISEYRWAWTWQEAVVALYNLGPLVMGSLWYSEMFVPDAKGYIKPGGAVAGGHAYLLDGVNFRKKAVRIKNSWGREWGRNGFAYLKFEHLAHLMNHQGEVCLATEIGHG